MEQDSVARECMVVVLTSNWCGVQLWRQQPIVWISGSEQVMLLYLCGTRM
jgi:hypothetical protein